MKKKKCNICKKEIKGGEAYCTLIEYDREWDERSIGHYHLKCYREKFLLQVGQANHLLDKANKLMYGMGLTT